jgi:hypothetical protein
MPYTGANSGAVNFDRIASPNLNNILTQYIYRDFKSIEFANAEQRGAGGEMLFVADGSFEHHAVNRALHHAPLSSRDSLS